MVAKDGVIGFIQKGYIMGIDLQGYLDRLSSLGMVQMPSQQDLQNVTVEKSDDTIELDSYIPSGDKLDDIVPSGTYSKSGMMVGEPATPGNASGTGNISSASDSGDSSTEEEEETTVRTVIINGQTYLETTTVENGVEIVTRTLI